jgi:hypothetical protein
MRAVCLTYVNSTKLTASPQCLSQNANTCGSVNHPNVAEFVGVYFDDNIAAVIRRFYERGSILELLRSTETINGTERARKVSAFKRSKANTENILDCRYWGQFPESLPSTLRVFCTETYTA